MKVLLAEDTKELANALTLTIITVAEDGLLTETTADEIIAGDFLVIYLDDDSVTNIVVYHAEDTTA